MAKKVLLSVVILIMIVGLLSGCKKTMNITDFAGMGDLPRNPSKIVFGTNSNTYNEETGWGESIEYEVKKEKITEITEKLFTVPYKTLPKDFVPNEMSEIRRYLIIYDDKGNTWNVHLRLRIHNGRMYSPANGDLITLLYEAINF